VVARMAQCPGELRAAAASTAGMVVGSEGEMGESKVVGVEEVAEEEAAKGDGTRNRCKHPAVEEGEAEVGQYSPGVWLVVAAQQAANVVAWALMVVVAVAKVGEGVADSQGGTGDSEACDLHSHTVPRGPGR